MDYKAEWSFQELSSDRIKMLSGCPPYSEIIRMITERIDTITFCFDEGRYEPVTGALRPLFYIKVGQELVDLFYNGVRGYRAQYYLSPENGEDANRYAIQQIEPKLLETARNANWCAPDPNCSDNLLHMDEAEIFASLRFPSAKIWGDETEGELSDVTKGLMDKTPPQIIAARWVAATENLETQSKAAKGVKAPCLSILKFHGAFIIKNGKERIPCGKKMRSEDIHRYGWS
jgi:hypothetical protein